MNYTNQTALPREEFALYAEDAVAQILKKEQHSEDLVLPDTFDYAGLFDEACKLIKPAARRLVTAYGAGKFSAVSFRDEQKQQNIVRLTLETFALA